MKTEVLYAGVLWTVEHDYFSGEPETGPTYACGGTPEVPASVDAYAVYVGEDDLFCFLTDETITALEEKVLERIGSDDTL